MNHKTFRTKYCAFQCSKQHLLSLIEWQLPLQTAKSHKFHGAVYRKQDPNGYISIDRDSQC